MKSKQIWNIQSGEMKVTDSGLISIVLGSCVSVIVYDPVLKIGGANHFLLPARSRSSEANELTPLHYGEESILMLLKEFKSRGSQPQNLIVKIVGGANDLGRSNLEVAEQVISRFGLKILNRSVGGELGRKVLFDPSTGELKCKLLSQQEVSEEVRQNPKFELSPVLDRKVRVLIVDDSKPIRMILRKIFECDSKFEVVGEANHPLEAEEVRRTCEPDLMTLDIQMPHQDGVSYLRSISSPLPFAVIVITDFGAAQGGPVVAAMEQGAFHYFQKPSLNEVTELGEKIRETSLHAVEAFRKKQISPKTKKPKASAINKLKRPSLIVIGSSTGGTEVVKEILVSLAEDSPPVLVVQHMPQYFTKAFADRMNELARIEIKEAAHGDKIQRGHAYIAAGGAQMACVRRHDEIYIKVTDDLPVNRFRPSVDYLFQSVVELDQSSRVLAILLTGMGNDGAKGMLELKNRGAYTIGQSEESCLVYGMPRVANEIGATRLMASTEEIVDLLSRSLSDLKVA